MPPFKKYKLSELVAKANTGLDAIKRAPIVSHDTGIKCLRIQDVSQSKDFKDWGFTEVSKDNYERFALKKDEIILARTGNTIGVNIYIDKDLKSVFNNGLIRLRTNKQICDPKYLYYNMQTTNYWSHIDSIAFGTSTQPNMQIESFLEYEIEMPDLPTQTRIASILSSLDDKIELNRRTNHTLEQIAQTLFKKYFVDDMDSENLPEGWRWGKLGEIVEVKGGTTPSTSNREFWGGKYHWTSPKDLSSLTFPVLLNTEKKITEAGLKQVSSGLLPLGTLLLSSRAPIGYLAITQIPVAINQGYIAILCNKGYSNYFMLDWIRQNMDIIIQNSNGSTFLEISKSVFRNIDVAIPPSELVKEFDKKVEAMFFRIVSNEKENIQLSKIRDSLLPKLMSGEIEVNVTEKELAEQ